MSIAFITAVIVIATCATLICYINIKERLIESGDF